jgi:small conductance mechanosensitive channel
MFVAMHVPIQLPDGEKLLDMAVHIALTIAVAWIAQRLFFLVVARFERLITRAHDQSLPAQQRARTLGQILRSLISVVVLVAAFIHVLSICGWDVKPLLAGAGILGVAVGFGAQWLVRDVIAGVFILVEDQFSVGDVIELDGKAASVEAITVRSTRLRDFNGFVHFVPNGSMKSVTNRSREWNRVAIDLPVDANADVDRALGAARDVVDAMNVDPQWKDRLLEPVQMWGLEQLSPAQAQIRLVLRARPGADAAEGARELRRRAHRALASAGVRLAGSVPYADAPAAPAARRDDPDATEDPS